jgi:hypothetical protein
MVHLYVLRALAVARVRVRDGRLLKLYYIVQKYALRDRKGRGGPSPGWTMWTAACFYQRVGQGHHATYVHYVKNLK